MLWWLPPDTEQVCGIRAKHQEEGAFTEGGGTAFSLPEEEGPGDNRGLLHLPLSVSIPVLSQEVGSGFHSEKSKEML